MFIRSGKGAVVSRAVCPVWLGVMFTDTAGLTDACILRPRNRNATSQNRPRNNIDNQNQSQQHESRGPGLPVPVLVRRDSIRENHNWKRRCWLVPAWTPVSIP